MGYGAKRFKSLIQSESDPVVKCNNCDTYHYESLGGARDNLNLQAFSEEGEVFKGCGNCKTDDYLTDL